jgi:hypothetical protein
MRSKHPSHGLIADTSPTTVVPTINSELDGNGISNHEMAPLLRRVALLLLFVSHGSNLGSQIGRKDCGSSIQSSVLAADDLQFVHRESIASQQGGGREASLKAWHVINRAVGECRGIGQT